MNKNSVSTMYAINLKDRVSGFHTFFRFQVPPCRSSFTHILAIWFTTHDFIFFFYYYFRLFILDVMSGYANEVILQEFVVLGCQTINIIEIVKWNDFLLLKEDIDGSCLAQLSDYSWWDDRQERVDWVESNQSTSSIQWIAASDILTN